MSVLAVLFKMCFIKKYFEIIFFIFLNYFEYKYFKII
jgi:hypothetical protein